MGLHGSAAEGGKTDVHGRSSRCDQLGAADAGHDHSGHSGHILRTDPRWAVRRVHKTAPVDGRRRLV